MTVRCCIIFLLRVTRDLAAPCDNEASEATGEILMDIYKAVTIGLNCQELAVVG